jgi:hypothetical protein
MNLLTILGLREQKPKTSTTEEKKIVSREAVESGTRKKYENLLDWYVESNYDANADEYIQQIQELVEVSEVPLATLESPEILFTAYNQLLDNFYSEFKLKKVHKLRTAFKIDPPSEMVQRYLIHSLTHGDCLNHPETNAEEIITKTKEFTGQAITVETLQSLANEEITRGKYRLTSILAELGETAKIPTFKPDYKPDKVQAGYLHQLVRGQIDTTDIKTVTHQDIEPKTILQAFDKLAEFGYPNYLIIINKISKYHNVAIPPEIREKMNDNLAKS